MKRFIYASTWYFNFNISIAATGIIHNLRFLPAMCPRYYRYQMRTSVTRIYYIQAKSVNYIQYNNIIYAGQDYTSYMIWVISYICSHPINSKHSYITHNYSCISKTIWSVLCQKQLSSVGTSNYISHMLWDVITFLCLCHLLIATLLIYVHYCPLRMQEPNRYPCNAMIKYIVRTLMAHNFQTSL